MDPGVVDTSVASHPSATGTNPRPPAHGLDAPTILWLASWFGLAAGFLDLASTVLQNRLIHGEFYRLGHGFPWVIPFGVASMVLVPGLFMTLVAATRARGIAVWVGVTPLAFLGFLDVIATLPLELWSALLLALGLAVQSVRHISTRPLKTLRAVRLTTPLLAATLLVTAVLTSGRHAWSEWSTTASLPPPPRHAKNIILIVWDTVRAKNLSLYGHSRPTSPNLERLAARGVRFGRAFATSSWTLPSHASLFTGRWPHELSAGWTRPLDHARPTLAARLGSLGYDTAGFVANLDYCGRETGLSRGFAHYEDYPWGVLEIFSRYVGVGRRVDRASIAMATDLLTGRRRGAARPWIPLSKEHAKSAADIDRAFLDWLAWQRPRGRPYFTFLNYNDAHTPYEAPDPSASPFGIRPESWHDQLALQQWNLLDKRKLPYRDVRMARDLYDDAIAYLDRRLGILVAELGRRQQLDDTLIVVTSDHGEHLGDHGLFFHGCSLYRPLVEVPLVLVDPKALPAARVIDEPVSLRDVPATILDLLGVESRPTFPGRSLRRLTDRHEGEPPPAFEPLLMELEPPTVFTNQGREPASKGPMKAMIAGGMHYIRTGDGHEELYALAADPDELSNVADRPDVEGILQGFRSYLRTLLRPIRSNRRNTSGPIADMPSRD